MQRQALEMDTRRGGRGRRMETKPTGARTPCSSGNGEPDRPAYAYGMVATAREVGRK